jgi:hypothetical protein
MRVFAFEPFDNEQYQRIEVFSDEDEFGKENSRPVKCQPTAGSWRADGIGMMISKARSGSL